MCLELGPVLLPLGNRRSDWTTRHTSTPRSGSDIPALTLTIPASPGGPKLHTEDSTAPPPRVLALLPGLTAPVRTPWGQGLGRQGPAPHIVALPRQPRPLAGGFRQTLAQSPTCTDKPRAPVGWWLVCTVAKGPRPTAQLSTALNRLKGDFKLPTAWTRCSPDPMFPAQNPGPVSGVHCPSCVPADHTVCGAVVQRSSPCHLGTFGDSEQDPHGHAAGHGS